MSKKFKVSLAALQEVDFEIEVEASNEVKAPQIAEDKFHNSMSEGEIVQFDFAEIRKDFEINKEDSKLSYGVNVQEIEDEDDAAGGEQHYQD